MAKQGTFTDIAEDAERRWESVNALPIVRPDRL
jgi:hypothetical protein